MNVTLIPARTDETTIDEFCNFQQRHVSSQFAKGFLAPAVWLQFLGQLGENEAEFWLAYHDGKPIGRIGASILPSHPGWGAVGFFECDLSIEAYPQVVEALLKQAIHWLKQKSCCKALGPMNLNTWFPYRFRSDKHINRRFSWEPVHPYEYLEEWRKFGFTQNACYKAFNTGCLDVFVNKTRPAYLNCLSQHYHFREFDHEYFIERDIPILYEMSMECFKDNHLFEPISFEAFRSLYVPIADKLDHSLGQICFAQDGSPAGFGFSFVDDDAFVIKSLATMPQHRGHGISNALAHLAGAAAYHQGKREYITAIIHTGAQSESYGKKGKLLWEHHYDLLELDI